VDSFTPFGLNDMGRALLQGRQWDSRIIVQEVPGGEAVVWRGNGAEAVAVEREVGSRTPGSG
jgi:hypothetical protein